MIAQGVLPFRYESEPTASGMTALAGLPPYLELAVVSGLTDSVRRHLRVCADQDQGWTDTQLSCRWRCSIGSPQLVSGVK